MEFGLLYDFRNPRQWRMPPAQLYAETLEHIVSIEGMGYDVAWVTEHHFIDDEYLPSVMPAAAAIAAKTSRITIGTAVLLLPLHNALRVAEDAAVVDVISNGRLRLGLGLGYKLEEFEAYGVPRKQRASLMDEGIEVIRRAWADGPASFDGRHYSFEGVDVTPTPTQRPGPEIWLAGRTEAPIRRAARAGDGLIAVGGPDLYGLYRSALDDAGKTGPMNLCVFATAFPSDDPGGDWERIGPHYMHRSENYADWYGTAADLESDRTWKAAVAAGGDRGTRERVLRSPDDVIAEVRAYEAMGVTSMLYFATFPGLPPSATLPMWELMAREVIPAFR